MKKFKPVNFLVLFFVIAIFSSLVFLVIKNIRQYRGPQQAESPLVEIKDQEKTLTVERSGHVEFKTPEGVFEQEWSNDKVNSLLQYLQKQYAASVLEVEEGGFQVTFFLNGQWVTFTLSDDDELVNFIFEEMATKGEDFEEGGGIEESIIDYFRKASPSPSAQEETAEGEEESAGEEATESAAQEPEGDDFFQDYTSGQGEAQDPLNQIICPFWRLSYCVYPQDWQPSPETIQWQGGTTVVVPDCDLWEATVTRRTVISNTICIEEPE